jgi:hypothetical protein
MLTPSHLPHVLDVWQLPHYTERFSLRAKIEALWEGTEVNACPFGPMKHLSAFSDGVPGPGSMTGNVNRNQL